MGCQLPFDLAWSLAFLIGQEVDKQYHQFYHKPPASKKYQHAQQIQSGEHKSCPKKGYQLDSPTNRHKTIWTYKFKLKNT